MPEKKKIKVKVKKRKLKIKRILGVFLILVIIALTFLLVKDLPIKNIYIIGNNILTDKEIIKLAQIESYPSFLETTSSSIKRKIKKNNYIKDVKVEKKFYNKIYIYIEEAEPLCIYNNNVILSNALEVENTYNITEVPILLTDITEIKDKFIKKISLINKDILLKISEISYAPNEVDKERLIFKMNDGNLVYVTLNKITKINKYNSIYSEMNDKKGIIYLDSGDYIELKD